MDILAVSLFSFVITILAIPITIFLAKRYGLMDDPNIRPHPAHVHKKITPRAGGLAIYLGIVFTILIFLPLTKALIGIVIGISILLVMGLIDDKTVSFNPYFRLVLLFFAAGAAVSSGVGISFIANPFYGLFTTISPFNTPIINLDQIVIPFNFFGPHKIILLADIFAFFWIISITQIINWSKGVDGQMPGITLVTAIILGVLSLKFYFMGDPEQLWIAKLAFIVAGTSLGFLLFNWHPAKIFPGFSGSTILAYMLAILAILSGAKVATAILILAVPTVDFVYTFFRRIFSGKSPVWADRGHLHHKLLDKLNWTPQKISLFYMAGSAILGLIALLVDTGSKLFGVIVVAVVFTGFVLWINSFGDLSEKPGQGNG